MNFRFLKKSSDFRIRISRSSICASLGKNPSELSPICCWRISCLFCVCVWWLTLISHRPNYYNYIIFYNAVIFSDAIMQCRRFEGSIAAVKDAVKKWLQGSNDRKNPQTGEGGKAARMRRTRLRLEREAAAGAPPAQNEWMFFFFICVDLDFSCWIFK